MRNLIVVAIVLFPATSFAQLPTAGEAMGKTDDGGLVKKVTEYDFEPDQVDGQPNKPLDENVNVPLHGKTSSLIDVRRDFVNEMLKTVEQM